MPTTKDRPCDHRLYGGALRRHQRHVDQRERLHAATLEFLRELERLLEAGRKLAETVRGIIEE